MAIIKEIAKHPTIEGVEILVFQPEEKELSVPYEICTLKVDSKINLLPDELTTLGLWLRAEGMRIKETYDSAGNKKFPDKNVRRIDTAFKTVAREVVETQVASCSYFQRRFDMSYERAEKIMTQLEEQGIVGPFKGSKPRDVLIKNLTELNDRMLGIDNEIIDGDIIIMGSK